MEMTPGHPYLSPLSEEFANGLPPTFLATGTRDLFLFNTIRSHRTSRAVGIQAEPHVVEAAGHGNFAGAPEDDAVDREARGFIDPALRRAAD